MLAKHSGIYILLGFLSLSVAYKITPIVISDGIPEFLNVTPEPFVKIGKGYYFIQSDIKKNWYAAYQSCGEIGASLIHFETIEEWNLVNSYINDTGIYERYWTSGTRLADKKNHAWFPTGKPMSLDIWLPGEPNNYHGNEFCDELGRLPGVPKFWGLNDLDCSAGLFYICKAEEPKTVSLVVHNL